MKSVRRWSSTVVVVLVLSAPALADTTVKPPPATTVIPSPSSAVIPPPTSTVIPPPASSVQPAPTSITAQPVQEVHGAPEFQVHAGIEAWSGENTYKIGFPVTDVFGNHYDGYFPFSELKFPLDVYFGVVKVNAVVRDRFVFDALVKKNISDPDDYMEDRDWITESDPGRLDIYSNSEVTGFDGFVFDVDLGYKVFAGNKGWLAAGAGYMYQDFKYDTALVSQWSPSGLSGFDYAGDGTLSIAYDVNYRIPYFLLSGQMMLSPCFKFNARFAYSPWVSAENTDQHVLRSKVNRGDLDGDAIILAIDGLYDFSQHWFMTAGLSHTSIEADGDMSASFSGYYDHTVTEELESDQTALYLTIGYRFGPSAEN